MRGVSYSIALIATALSFIGWDCGAEESGPAAPQGPPGAILEFDAAAIGQKGSEAGSGSAGSGQSSSGSAGSGQTSGVGGG